MSYLNIHPSFELHEGFKNALFVNTEQGFHFQIDPDMRQLLKKVIGKPVDQAINSTELQAINYLLENNIVVEESLPRKKSIVRTPAARLNSIIHQENIDGLDYIFTQMADLDLHDYELRIESPLDRSSLTTLFNMLSSYEIDNLDLLITVADLSKKELIGIVEDCKFYLNIFIKNSSFSEPFENQKIKVILLHYEMDLLTACGKINKDYFLTEREDIAENQKHNSCLRGKISIDKDGEIKNCPSMIDSYGNINNSSLQSIIKSDQFTKFWNLSKDNIKVCQDCEYRFVCTDCRAFTVDNELLGKPLKCNYDPYSGIWSE